MEGEAPTYQTNAPLRPDNRSLPHRLYNRLFCRYFLANITACLRGREKYSERSQATVRERVSSYLFNEGPCREAAREKLKLKQMYSMACVHAPLGMHNARLGSVLIFKGKMLCQEVLPKVAQGMKKAAQRPPPTYRSPTNKRRESETAALSAEGQIPTYINQFSSRTGQNSTFPHLYNRFYCYFSAY